MRPNVGPSGVRPSTQEAAHQVLAVVPQVMAVIRTEMRRHRSCELSLPQLRTLGYLEAHADTSLTAVADFIGLTLPSMSKLVDGLVGRGLVVREFDRGDRRRITLRLTSAGSSVLAAAHDSTRAYLAGLLADLRPEQRQRIFQALEDLRPLLVARPPAAVEGNGRANVDS